MKERTTIPQNGAAAAAVLLVDAEEEKKEESSSSLLPLATSMESSPPHSKNETVNHTSAVFTSTVRLVDHCNTGAATAAGAMSAAAAAMTPESSSLLGHVFAPGDHVIRWEMLPIAWPIQIHGIVLATTQHSVTLADFGLTAKPVVNPSTTTSIADVDDLIDTPVQPFIDHPVSQKVEKAIVAAWEKLRPHKADHQPRQRRQRITVQTITDSKELSRWKKVNYDGNMMFGLGGGGGTASAAAAAADQDATMGVTDKSWLQKMTSTWHGKNDGSAPPPSGPKMSNRSTVEDGSETATTSDDTAISHNPWLTNMNFWSKNNSIAPQTPEKLSGTKDDPATRIESDHRQQMDHASPEPSWWQRMPHWNCERALVGYAETPEKPLNEGTNDLAAAADWSQPEGSSTAPDDKWTQRKMNPAMAKLMEQQQEAANESSTAVFNKRPSKTLPKADPPKLILARTHFLLTHGESILPAYHVFHSNSECIAVFCTTGRWSTLQTSVFLHSSAIGNAKGAAAMTLGAAAAVPMVAPVVAGLGLAMVGMPWWMLRDSKVKWEGATKSLTEKFWAQADNEVILECIVKWSDVAT